MTDSKNTAAMPLRLAETLLKALMGAMLCAMLAFPSAAFAEASGDDQLGFEREFLLLDCVSSEPGGTLEYTCCRYILLCNDGTGLFVPSALAYQLTDWNTGDGKFTATTSQGDVIEGTIDENYVVTFKWDGYTFGFQFQEGMPPIADLNPDTWYVSLPHVLDKAGLLSDTQVDELEARAAALSDKYECAVHLVVVDDMGNYSEWGQKGYVDAFAEEVAQGYNLGYGEDRDMIVLVMSMADRDFSLISYGPFGKEEVFTANIREKVVDGFKPAFKDNEWYRGFNDYLDSVEKAFVSYETGTPMARPSMPLHIIVSVLFSLAIGFVIAYLISILIRNRSKSVTAVRGADKYAVPNGAEITYRSDDYLRTTESMVYSPRPEKSDSDSSSYSSSSGFGHTSGKF